MAAILNLGLLKLTSPSGARSSSPLVTVAGLDTQFKMSGSTHRVIAKLSDLPVNFSTDFLKATMLSLKCKQQGFKYFSEGYIHDVKMFCGDGNSVITSAHSHRSMKKNEKPHAIHMDIQTTEISFAHCSCQAGASGSCSHVVGFILALQQWQMMGFTEVPAKLSSTSLPEQWSLPRGSKIQPVDVAHLTFVNPKPDRKKRPIQNTVTECRMIKVQKEDIETLQTLGNCPIGYLVSTSNSGRTVDTHLGPVPIGSGLSTHARFFEAEEIKAVGTVCGNLEFPQPSAVTLKEEYVNKCKTTMTVEQCIQLENNTRDQSSSPLWAAERKDRLTASNFGTILKRKKISETFINSIITPKAFTSIPTNYGKNNEKVAISKYTQKTGNHVHDCGLIVNSFFPFLGATPDGKVCEKGKTGLIEVKCPYTARDCSIDEACKSNKFCLKKTDLGTCLKEDHQYYCQVQGQLMVSGAGFCDLVVYTKKDLFIERVFPNIAFMQNMLDNLSGFYYKYVEPVICAM